MPWQSCAVSVRNARNPEGEVLCRLADRKKVAEEVAQMRGRGLVPRMWLGCLQVLQEGDDVRCRNLRQVSRFLAETELQETIRVSPAMENCSIAQATLTAQIRLIVPSQLRA